jgi:hypothetical protein
LETAVGYYVLQEGGREDQLGRLLKGDFGKTSQRRKGEEKRREREGSKKETFGKYSREKEARQEKRERERWARW